MQSDPFLKQVVTRSLEAGLRGRAGEGLRWQFAAYRAVNRDDILFVAAGASRGYFQNFGRTRRQGLEASLAGAAEDFEWSLGYALVDATYQSPALIVSPNNSSRGTAPGTAEDEILVQPGDRIPNVPRHQLKLAGRWQASRRMAVDLALLAYSGQYLRGNENNQHQAGEFAGRTYHGSGRAAGYALVNLATGWRLDRGFEIIGRIDNLFDRRYATAGQLGESAFPGGAFEADPGLWRKDSFFAPGAPRAFWLGIRFAGEVP
jgi:outer membrane receptor protein involved in Fe transport